MSFICPEEYSLFDTNRIIIEAPKQLQSEFGQKFARLQIRYKYPNGTIGPLVVQTPILFTYGITFGSTALKKETATPQLSLVTFNPESGPTAEESTFIALCNSVLEKIKQHMLLDSTKEDLGKWNYDSDVHAMKIFYVKMEKGRPVKGYPPTLYSKLYYKIENNETIITSKISCAVTGDSLPTHPLLGRGKIYTTVIFSNIYVGNKPSIQTRIGEIMVVERHDRPCHLKPMTAPAASPRSNEPPVFKLKSLMKANK